MLTFTKGDDVKFLDAESGLVKALLEDGWECPEIKPEEKLKEDVAAEEDREALLEKARKLGLEPHHRCGAEKLKAMIEEAEGQA